MATLEQIQAVQTLEAATTDSERAGAATLIALAYPYSEIDPADGVLKVVAGKTTYDIQAGNGNAAVDATGAIIPGEIAGGDPYELLYAGKPDSNI